MSQQAEQIRMSHGRSNNEEEHATFGHQENPQPSLVEVINTRIAVLAGQKVTKTQHGSDYLRLWEQSKDITKFLAVQAENERSCTSLPHPEDRQLWLIDAINARIASLAGQVIRHGTEDQRRREPIKDLSKLLDLLSKNDSARTSFTHQRGRNPPLTHPPNISAAASADTTAATLPYHFGSGECPPKVPHPSTQPDTDAGTWKISCQSGMHEYRRPKRQGTTNSQLPPAAGMMIDQLRACQSLDSILHNVHELLYDTVEPGRESGTEVKGRTSDIQDNIIPCPTPMKRSLELETKPSASDVNEADLESEVWVDNEEGDLGSGSSFEMIDAVTL